jgi:Zn-dependent protease with chaperone function
MSISPSLYPPAPPGIPKDLTAPTARYRRQVLLVLASLLLFVLLYIGLVVGTAYLAWWSITYPIGQVMLLKIGLIGMSAMLFLFFLKGLFKTQRSDITHYVPITTEDQPELFAFIRELCRETRAPFPKRIYLTAEVNAAVFYDTSLLSLIVPVRKNLLIGLGLVNVLTLDEFKAVLAHEFGHFSQSSMKLGSYVYTTNRIITDMVYGRDSWDRFLAQWQGVDVRIGVFAWILAGIVWVLRKILAGIFRVINLGNLALSRQMEFNADLVAVSVTGSDSLVHALAKLDFASRALNQAVRDLQAASDHGLYSADLFHHQKHSLGFLRKLAKDSSLGMPPELPADPNARSRVFEPGKGETPSMWATHPSNHERENNAKRVYFRSHCDERSPWLLFHNVESVKSKITTVVYRSWVGPKRKLNLSDPEVVQAFIEDEHSETTYDPRYHGLYDGRYLEEIDLDAVSKEFAWDAEKIASELVGLYGGGLADWVTAYNKRLGEYDLLDGLRRGHLTITGKEFTFRDQPCRAGDVDRLFKMVEKELEADRQRLSVIDRQVFAAYYQAGRDLPSGLSQELLDRYRFHFAVQKFLRNLSGQRANVENVLQYLSTNPKLDQTRMAEVMGSFRAAHDTLNHGLQEATRLQLPELKNITAGASLGRFLLDEPLIAQLPGGNSIEGRWIGEFMKHVALVQDRLQRVHFKSLGGILALQEKIGRAWQERTTQTQAGPVAPAADSH